MTFLPTLFDIDIRGSQRYMANKCHELEGVILAVDVALGKTGAVILFLYELFMDDPTNRVLVVAPKKVATDTWPTDLNRWRHSRRKLSYSVIVGTPKQRTEALREDTFIHVINKENLPWLWKTLRNGKDWDYDVLVIDEASMLKEGKKRTKRANRKGKGSMPLSRFGVLSAARKKVHTVVEMTGTPLPEGIENLWGLAYIVDQGKRLGATKTAFHQRWFYKGFNGYDLNPRPGAEKQITRKISDIMISLRAEDHLELPSVVTTPTTDIWVDLPTDIMREYKKFERELFTERYDVEAVTSGVLVNKLLQFANGSLYRSKDEVVPVHELKLDALADLVDELDGHPLLVSYSFRFDRDAIRKRLGRKIVFLDEEGAGAIDNWNKRKYRVMGAHPAQIGHGTNLQFGGHHLCWYGLCHSGELYRQMNGRLPRPGQRSPHVIISHILARGTWDENIIQNQDFKKGKEDAIRRQVRVTKQMIDEELRRAA